MSKTSNRSMNEFIITWANGRSLARKVSEIRTIAKSEKADKMIFGKTLTPRNKNNVEYQIEGYHLAIRVDKNSFSGVGGGIMVYIKEE